jgi:branched-chain amino acid transport system permease protein
LRADGRRRWYLCLAIFLLVAPWILPDYWLEQLAFVFIYSIISVGLMLLTGYTGQFSIGHAAFMGVGAYTEAYLVSMGWPLPLSLAAAMFLSAGVGVMVGLPALRVRGIYLAIATLSFAIIVEEVMARWQSVTGGGSGRTVSSPGFLGWTFSSSMSLYFLCLVCLVGSTLIVMNLLRAPTGRAFVAIRDSEISAQSMGIAVVRYKLISFAISAALAGLGGALYAHKIKYLSPDQFGVVQSIDLLMMVIIGGLGSLHGAFFGAIFLIGLPQLISLAKDYLPTAIGQTAGLQGFVYGIVLIGFVMLEPQGLYGRWLKIRTWLQLYPFYRRGMLSRQRVFQRSERLK